MGKNLKSFINKDYIERLLKDAENVTREDIQKVLDKSKEKMGLSHEDIAVLLQIKDKDQMEKMFNIADKIKKSIYGNRIVLFAPLYVSNFCVNKCVYCGYSKCNEFPRRKLSMEELEKEVRILEKMGHKRLALEAGEDPVNCDINYIIDAIKIIYKTQNENGNIRRINVNIAATNEQNYKKLKDAEIGTYILFQETYNKEAYEKMHPNCLKGDYEYHLNAFDRAMHVGIEDVGGGVLFGLADYKFEVLGLMLHNEHLEQKFGVGFHTISVPRLKKAEGMTLENFPNIVDDETFKKIIAILRIAVPYTGMILSTRETPKMRSEALKFGISQISAGSCTGVGGYKEHEEGKGINQFDLSDHRSPIEVLKGLVKDGYIPSYCTACYRKGRTGTSFMELAKSGKIQHACGPNAMATLMEFLMDYADEELYTMGIELINREIEKIENETVRNLTKNNIERIKNGERDLYI